MQNGLYYDVYINLGFKLWFLVMNSFQNIHKKNVNDGAAYSLTTHSQGHESDQRNLQQKLTKLSQSPMRQYHYSDKLMQRKALQNQPSVMPNVDERAINRTGLPNRLKSGMESISGLNLDPVRVFYNSNKPATIQAHGFTQGNHIHLAPGQERHLPHELGHVVQQMQSRVKPTGSIAEMSLNDSPALENEASQLGVKALQNNHSTSPAFATNSSVSVGQMSKLTVQRKIVTGSYSNDPCLNIFQGLKNIGMPKTMLRISGAGGAAYTSIKTRPTSLDARISAPIQNGRGVGNSATVGAIGRAEENIMFNKDIPIAGGHIIGAQLFSNPDKSYFSNNLIPMLVAMNNSTYALMESTITDHINSYGGTVSFKAEMKYKNSVNKKVKHTALDQHVLHNIEFSNSFENKRLAFDYRTPYLVTVTLKANTVTFDKTNVTGSIEKDTLDPDWKDATRDHTWTAHDIEVKNSRKRARRFGSFSTSDYTIPDQKTRVFKFWQAPFA